MPQSPVACNDSPTDCTASLGEVREESNCVEEPPAPRDHDEVDRVVVSAAGEAPCEVRALVDRGVIDYNYFL